jgi:hypothetical protein
MSASSLRFEEASTFQALVEVVGASPSGATARGCGLMEAGQVTSALAVARDSVFEVGRSRQEQQDCGTVIYHARRRIGNLFVWLT